MILWLNFKHSMEKNTKKILRFIKLKKNFVYDGKMQADGNDLFAIIDKLKILKERFSNPEQNKNFIDVPFSELIPNEIKQHEWYHKAIGACLEGVDFNNFTTADAYLNFKHNGHGDGFVKEGSFSSLKNLPVSLNTID